MILESSEKLNFSQENFKQIWKLSTTFHAWLTNDLFSIKLRCWHFVCESN